MTNEGHVSAHRLRNWLITAAFARNLLLRFSRGDVQGKSARHILIIEGGHFRTTHDVTRQCLDLITIPFAITAVADADALSQAVSVVVVV